MEQDENTTIVVFRKFPGKNGDVFALFPYEIHLGYLVNSYQHIGQHSGADLAIIRDTHRARPEEYAELKAELESIGYKLEVKQKVNYKKYLQAVHAA